MSNSKRTCSAVSNKDFISFCFWRLTCKLYLCTPSFTAAVEEDQSDKLKLLLVPFVIWLSSTRFLRMCFPNCAPRAGQGPPKRSSAFYSSVIEGKAYGSIKHTNVHLQTCPFFGLHRTLVEWQSLSSAAALSVRAVTPDPAACC